MATPRFETRPRQRGLHTYVRVIMHTIKLKVNLQSSTYLDYGVTYFTLVRREAPKSTASLLIKYPAVMCSLRLLPSGMLITRSTFFSLMYEITDISSTISLASVIATAGGLDNVKTSKS